MSLWHEWQEAPSARFGVIGDPISHSKSPILHNAWLSSVGLKEEYQAVRVPAQDFAQALEYLTHLGYEGINVTLPLKEQAFGWARSHDAESLATRASNTLNLPAQEGRNTDVAGFLAAVSDLCPTEPRSAVVLGAGGAARAAIYALSTIHCTIRIWNRTQSRAEQLVEDLGILAHVITKPSFEGADLLVNCVAGTSPVDLELPWESADPSAAVLDIMTAETQFLREAAAHGLRTANGETMLIEQGALSMEYWMGCAVDRKVLRCSLLEAR